MSEAYFAGAPMSWLVIIRIVVLRLLVIGAVLLAALLAIALIDSYFGTSIIAFLWQWAVKLWSFLVRSISLAGKALTRSMPMFFKRFAIRRGTSGVWRIVTSGLLALLFMMLGHDRYHSAIARSKLLSARGKAAALHLWNVEIWFLPRWLRAGIFVLASVAVIWGFVEIQAWAERGDMPTVFGIDPWSFAFGFIASFFLTKLPLIGFDHFVNFVMRPLRVHYRRIIRRKGWFYVLLNWLAGLRPLRRRAELERKRLMRRHRQKMRAQAESEVE